MIDQKLNQLLEKSNYAINIVGNDRFQYAQFLAQTYFYVKNTTKVIALFAANCKDMNMHKFALKHLSEEADHEVMLIKDLENLGYHIEDFTENPITRLLWQSQWYYIHQHNPVTHLGFSVFLEAMAVRFGKEIINRVKASFGGDVTLFLDVHANVDEHHVSDSLKVAELLSDEDKAVFVENMVNAQYLYTEFLKAIGSQEIKAA